MTVTNYIEKVDIKYNKKRDYLILFCADYKIELFKIESEKKDGVPSARITQLQVITPIFTI